jgi:putative flippase GtrA
LRTTFVRFAVVGFGSNILNYGVYAAAYWLGLYITVASVLGYLVGLFNSYYLGKVWVFKKNLLPNKALNAPEILRFCLVYTVGGIGMCLITDALNRLLGVDYRLSWFFGAGFAFVNNYAGSKWIIFKERKTDGN